MNYNAILKTSFHFKGIKSVYNGKVRDVYNINDHYLVMIATDRISAFDVVLPKPIPYKGQVLNQIAAKFLKDTEDIVPNWVIDVPDPNVTIGKYCQPYAVEMVIRGYLTGHAWRVYKSGNRNLCGNILPEGLNEHDKLPKPIITPTTKAKEGHDEDISMKEIISSELIQKNEYVLLEEYTQKLFQRGTEIALKQGLILVDTKYEFGKQDGRIHLIDEIHTPDSSRYFYADGYEERQSKKEPQKQLSKEFVREWLMEKGFQGKDGQKIPEMNDDFIETISNRYIELYEKITSKKFIKSDGQNPINRIEKNIKNFLSVKV